MSVLLNYLLVLWSTSPLFFIVAGTAVRFIPVEQALLLGFVVNAAAALALYRAIKDEPGLLDF